MSHELSGEQRGRLIQLLQRDSLRLGQFTLASGRSSHYYIDGRKVTLGAEGARLIGQGVLGLLAAHGEVVAVGGLTMGADPIVGAALALAPSMGAASCAASSSASRPRVMARGTWSKAPWSLARRWRSSTT